ncbi:hypothetical protein Pla175_32920 [Pirellulimonas nuda]|uniref:GHMP kinase C-terminal domain-containing protein n=1 Tax=Pirellulimonas nuda TaxID=2528009 RepID=A0A518DEI6_9BACT|nr:beta-RFAP synthase [Pirellulimonas nuda]QDU89895.1 hypothetical protein Pla175_32920 [Pirellulimonas nuda]
MTRHVEVAAASRLHFGLFGVGGCPDAKPGGVGAMIDNPRLVVRATDADRFTIAGAHAERTQRVAQRVAEACLGGRLPALQLETVQSPELHTGLGVGTQHALAVAACMLEALALPRPAVGKLAEIAGRGMRSAIGSHGFDRGGLIVDEGCAGPGLAPMAARVALPSQWRFVLSCEESPPGLAGADERHAFTRLSRTPSATVDRLRRLALGQLAPAAEAVAFHRFAEALHAYGEEAGRCFAEVQGGAFASPAIERRIDWLRERGVVGCGQSSWGPTVFALAPDADSASGLAAQLVNSGVAPTRVKIAAPANEGAAVSTDRRPT